MFSHAFLCPAEIGHKANGRPPLTLGAAGGSFTAIAWKLLTDSLSAPAGLPVVVDCPLCDCPDLPRLLLGSLDLNSVVIGILIGLVLGPTLDLLVLIRASWRWWVRNRLRELASRGSELYRFA